jgi:hypothetical protein
MDYLEFIARVTSHIPDKGQVTTRYYGLYSNGGKMSIISFIEEPKTIDRIIRHLELTFEVERPPTPRVVQQELLMASLAVFCRFGDGV